MAAVVAYLYRSRRSRAGPIIVVPATDSGSKKREARAASSRRSWAYVINYHVRYQISEDLGIVSSPSPPKFIYRHLEVYRVVGGHPQIINIVVISKPCTDPTTTWRGRSPNNSTTALIVTLGGRSRLLSSVGTRQSVGRCRRLPFVARQWLCFATCSARAREQYRRETLTSARVLFTSVFEQSSPCPLDGRRPIGPRVVDNGTWTANKTS